MAFAVGGLLVPIVGRRPLIVPRGRRRDTDRALRRRPLGGRSRAPTAGAAREPWHGGASTSISDPSAVRGSAAIGERRRKSRRGDRWCGWKGRDRSRSTFRRDSSTVRPASPRRRFVSRSPAGPRRRSTGCTTVSIALNGQRARAVRAVRAAGASIALPIPAGLLRAGRNEVAIDVRTGDGPWRFAVAYVRLAADSARRVAAAPRAAPANPGRQAHHQRHADVGAARPSAPCSRKPMVS